MSSHTLSLPKLLNLNNSKQNKDKEKKFSKYSSLLNRTRSQLNNPNPFKLKSQKISKIVANTIKQKEQPINILKSKIQLKYYKSLKRSSLAHRQIVKRQNKIVYKKGRLALERSIEPIIKKIDKLKRDNYYEKSLINQKQDIRIIVNDKYKNKQQNICHNFINKAIQKYSHTKQLTSQSNKKYSEIPLDQFLYQGTSLRKQIKDNLNRIQLSLRTRSKTQNQNINSFGGEGWIVQ